jgi:hypothetical protein
MVLPMFGFKEVFAFVLVPQKTVHQVFQECPQSYACKK